MLLYYTYLSLKDKLEKAQHEREELECQLKTEKDEKELYKVIYFLPYLLPVASKEMTPELRGCRSAI